MLTSGVLSSRAIGRYSYRRYRPMVLHPRRKSEYWHVPFLYLSGKRVCSASMATLRSKALSPPPATTWYILLTVLYVLRTPTRKHTLNGIPGVCLHPAEYSTMPKLSKSGEVRERMKWTADVSEFSDGESRLFLRVIMQGGRYSPQCWGVDERKPLRREIRRFFISAMTNHIAPLFPHRSLRSLRQSL